MHMINNVANEATGDGAKIRAPYLTFKMSVFDRALYEKPYILIQGKVKGDSKLRDFTEINSIIKSLNYKGHRVYNIGGLKNEGPVNNIHCVKNLYGFSWLQVQNLIKNCAMFVGPNSSFTLLAAIQRKPTITLHKFFSPITHGNDMFINDNIEIQEGFCNLSYVQKHLDLMIFRYLGVK